jgi:tetratricopeptide (TPR) repeat protein
MSRRVLLGLVLFVGVLLANQPLGAWRNETLHPEGPQQQTPIAIMLSVLGDLRTFLAQQVMMESDIYHHEMESQGVVWTQEWDIESMYKLVTVLDPHYEEAYDIGAYQLVRNFNKVDIGLAFLDEGLRNNPNSYQLHMTKAELLFFLKRYEEEIPQAGRALQLAWPELAKTYDDPRDKMGAEVNVINAARMLAHGYERVGNTTGEVHALKIWLYLRPNDPIPIGMMKKLGLEPKGYTPADFERGL